LTNETLWQLKFTRQILCDKLVESHETISYSTCTGSCSPLESLHIFQWTKNRPEY
jgi:hypothetical protein